MFTGLIEEIGEIVGIIPNPEGKIFSISCRITMENLKIGDSVAVDGVCLTVVDLSENRFSAQAVHESLERSTLGIAKTGNRVNLERAMPANGRFGGHFVQGHIDGIAEIISWKFQSESAVLTIKIPDEFIRFIAEKGSIAVNGISLTIAKKEGLMVSIALIPTTLKTTNLSLKNVRDFVNIEVDLMAKYVENFLHQGKDALTSEKIKGWGFGRN
ncbi:MAG: riboflavin synthase [Candidatus Marinimicrobia bacterium CG08_land_8_20_14_0_20_45_22]|nr:MAG: riboflavin synthase [Candidatus Marinimicrobia bacterium CG08_land_8_20_14_0_20_45_22]